MIPTCSIPLPAGYEPVSMEFGFAHGTDKKVLRVVWTAPLVPPIYVATEADETMLKSEELWQTMLESVREYAQGIRDNPKVGVSKSDTYRSGSNRQLPTPTIEIEYTRGPTVDGPL